jgi:hypothetical protein
MVSQARLALVAAASLGGVGELLRRRRAARPAASRPDPPQPDVPPPLTTQSSPGQIADLQQSYGADMAPTSASEG